MTKRTYTWRSATADDIGRLVRAYDVDDDPIYECEHYGIFQAIETHDDRPVYLVMSDTGSNPHNFCEVQVAADQ
jgi:hypothetical protein